MTSKREDREALIEKAKAILTDRRDDFDAADAAFKKRDERATWGDPMERDAAVRWHWRGFQDGAEVARRPVQGEPKHSESCGERCNHCSLCGEGILYGSRCPEHYLNQPQGEPTDAAKVVTLEDVYESTSLKELVAEARSEGTWCCENGCGTGACETCPCCSAGWCVSGIDGVPEDPDDRERWLEVAAEYNPAAAALRAAAAVTEQGGENR